MQTTFRQILLLLAVAGFAAQAQESGSEVTEEAARAAEIDELEPSMSMQDLTAKDEVSEPNLSSQELSAERGVIEAAVPKAVLAKDVRRRVVNNGVMDGMMLERTEITGNQELPKVLYIVPWQKSDPEDLTGKPVNT